MNVYHFNPETGEFLGSSVADTDPLDPSHVLVPAFSTDIPPPEEEEGYYRVFANGEWVQVEIPPPPEPVIDVDSNIRNAPSDLFGGPQLKDVFNGN